MEYVDNFNPYIYCGQNPWGRWDPLGLTVEDGSKNLGVLRVWANQIYDAQKAANGGKSSAEIEQRRAETNLGFDKSAING